VSLPSLFLFNSFYPRYELFQRTISKSLDFISWSVFTIRLFLIFFPSKKCFRSQWLISWAFNLAFFFFLLCIMKSGLPNDIFNYLTDFPNLVSPCYGLSFPFSPLSRLAFLYLFLPPPSTALQCYKEDASVVLVTFVLFLVHPDLFGCL